MKKFGLISLLVMILFSGLFSHSVSASQRWRWQFSGSAELSGFSSKNEPTDPEESSDDTGTMLRLKLGVECQYRDYLSAHVTLVSEGASRYALILSDNHESYYGTVASASGSDFIPVIDEAQINVTTAAEIAWLSAGLIRPNRFSKYALPGSLIGYRFKDISLEAWAVDAGKRDSWRGQDVQLKNGLEVSDGIDAVFYGARLSGKTDTLSGWIEVTMLNDKTPDEDRWNSNNSYWGPIREDKLGTATAQLSYSWHGWSADVVASANFGHAVSDEDRDDMDYSGKRLDARLEYRWGLITVLGRYLYQSGARYKHPDNDNEESYDEFTGFSYYAPTNSALYDSHYFRESGPPVLLGSRKTPFYGIPRPNLHGDMSSPENLIASSVSLMVEPLPSLILSATAWKISADEVYWVYNGSDYFKPSTDLGWEMDMAVNWYPVKGVAVNAFYGIFFPGDFYRDIEPYYPFGLSVPIEKPWIDNDRISLGELSVTLWF